ncbi:RDD family protein [Mucilaginibacter terrenus]|uniref:RDD family protein n=1 Tax=Mucilaginibacter terrenus TaxID=2482727 RepID=A0A3E2NXT3_9SPHI|nr:RDD family protein [Mucilaginibacter terrenus]RFZ85749.1 RDD family protein [Mucilaginibacter terrenus]
MALYVVSRKYISDGRLLLLKRISETIVEQTVHRPSRGDDGKLQYQELTFQLHYNPAIESHFPRLWAKLIDMTLFFIPLQLVTHDSWWSALISVVVATIYGTLLEHYYGCTLGKKIIRLKVLDDYGNFPPLFLSLKRNALASLNLSQLPGVKFRFPDPDGLSHRYNMNLNNTVCQTYVVDERKVTEIREMLA